MHIVNELTPLFYIHLLRLFYSMLMITTIRGRHHTLYILRYFSVRWKQCATHVRWRTTLDFKWFMDTATTVTTTTRAPYDKLTRLHSGSVPIKKKNSHASLQKKTLNFSQTLKTISHKGTKNQSNNEEGLIDSVFFHLFPCT